EHVEQTVAHMLMADDRHAALLALLRIGERIFIGCARDTDENRSHGSVRAAKDGIHRILVLFRLHGHEIERHLDIIEEYLALIESALAELVERLAARDAGQIERHEEDNTLARAAAAIERREENRIFRNRAVRHPCRLLTV